MQSRRSSEVPPRPRELRKMRAGSSDYGGALPSPVSLLGESLTLEKGGGAIPRREEGRKGGERSAFNARNETRWLQRYN